MKPLITVIIPIYNVEKYLSRAVDSVLGQTYRNLDIILVDDGSPDGCPQICDSYAAREARVRVIHKENGGLSDARNAGLRIAGGDYIAFLDSDDYYAPRFIEILYEEISRHDAQVAVCTYETTKALKPEDGPDFGAYCRQYEQGRIQAVCYDREEMLKNQYDALCQDATYFIVAWNKLYKASLWKGVTFPEGKIHEDEATIYKVFDRIQKGVYVRMPLYAYFSMPESITRKAFSLTRLDWLDALGGRIDYFNDRGETELLHAALRARADGAIRFYAPLTQTHKKAAREKKRLRRAVSGALRANCREMLHGRRFLSMRTMLGYRLFLLFPQLYVRLLQH